MAQLSQLTPYVLHCYHNDHPCEHGYMSLHAAIEAAHVGLQSGILQAAYRITRNDVVVMSEEALRHRLGELAAIPFN